MGDGNRQSLKKVPRSYRTFPYTSGQVIGEWGKVKWNLSANQQVKALRWVSQTRISGLSQQNWLLGRKQFSVFKFIMVPEKELLSQYKCKFCNTMCQNVTKSVISYTYLSLCFSANVFTQMPLQMVL